MTFRLYILMLAVLLSACQNLPTTTSHGAGKEKAAVKITFASTSAANTVADTATESIVETTPAPAAPADLWPRFQEGLQLRDSNHPEVQANINWYIKNRRILETSQPRMRYYLHFIMDELEKQGIPYDVALIPLIESQYNPFASAGQPVGMWQFMPATARNFNLYSNHWYDGRKDPVESTKAVATYFRYLMNYFNNDFMLALAAYNSGEGTVQNAINRNRRQGKPTDYWSLDLPRVTENYIPKMVALAEIFRHPDKYNLALQPIPDQPWFGLIKVDTGITLAQVAQTLLVDQEELRYLNAGLKPGTWPDRARYSVNVPADKVMDADRLLALAPKLDISRPQLHTIRSGESLGGIARKYGISVQQLRAWNGLKSDTIIAGKTLMVARTASTSSTAKTTGATPATKARSHTVKSGESLWKIARIYKVRMTDLAQWNRKNIDSPLKTGEKLIIPTRRTNP